MKKGGSESGFRVLRGGSWNNPARNLASAIRNRNQPTNRNQNVGFRCVLPVPAEHASGAGGPRMEACRRRPGQAGTWCRPSETALPGRSSQRRSIGLAPTVRPGFLVGGAARSARGE